MPRRKEITLWQLEVLARAAEMADRVGGSTTRRPSFTDVADSLDVPRQKVVGALERLKGRYGHRVVREVDGKVFVANPDAARHAAAAVAAIRHFEAAAAQGDRYLLRVDGYWAHLVSFLAEAMTSVADDTLQVQLAPGFGSARSSGGAGLAHEAATGIADLVVAPVGSRMTGARSIPSHRVVLMAALRPDHELLTDEVLASRTVRASRLLDERQALLVSPRGHFSRDRLAAFESSGRRFAVETEGPEPSALVALSQTTAAIAIISSDSVLPSGLPGQGEDPWQLPDHWLAVTDDDGRLLGREYEIVYRTAPGADGPAGRERPHVPEAVAEALDSLAKTAARLAHSRLDRRLTPWPGGAIAR